MINRKSNSRITALIIVLTLFLGSCTTKTPSDLSKESIIPKPVSVIPSGEYFTIKSGTGIYINGKSEEMNKVGEFLAERLRPTTGFMFRIKHTDKPPRQGNIYLTLSGADANIGAEGYKLEITKKLITITAKSPAGLFLGIQTIRQILPAKSELTVKQEGPWKIATGTITDYPAYYYRGAMLDVARHFFPIADVKRFIDFLACYKMNVLHLHLSDDQGWRIEIKMWPNLTSHGGSTQVGGGKGGYYTQEQYAEIVRYADDHYITIVPEIDMPGHTNAALASYAELNCSGKATEPYTGTNVGFSTLCTDKDVTYEFIEDVVRELSAITTGPLFHIGGDESHSTKRNDYIKFVNKVQEIVEGEGKVVIGWDDIAIAGLKPAYVAQHWANSKNAILAVSQGAKLVMSPAAKAYIDMKYDSTTTLGLHWAGYIEVDSAYCWDPATVIPGIGKENIAGVEAPLWTETITNMDEIEYMVFPRLPGYAEIGWTPLLSRNWDEYKVRLGKQAERFKAMEINYYQSPLVPWVQDPK
jgi:hexosaminidase